MTLPLCHDSVFLSKQVLVIRLLDYAMKKAKKILRKTKPKRRASAVLDGYRAITKEEMRNLKKMTIKDSIEQTEILLRAAKWMK